ncbi:UvrD/REP helicase [mine drainage metagenome]|uniref:UvrD/REP helicase n=1 Tax=mine drainage metagenome TaxID=410659 RepID=T1A1N2_9ZZZZ
MEIIADLHVHSRYAMACSSNISIRGMEAAALEKGINVISAADFTHPLWLNEIEENLEEDGSTGLYKVKGSASSVRFILGTEVSTVYTGDDNKVKKIHHCLLMSDIGKVKILNDKLGKYGSLGSDGRPTLSISAPELVDMAKSVDPGSFIFPAHAWTPWFGVFGSMSGFDSLKDAYKDREKDIYAIESGLSSDPKMNWRISALDKYSIISNSDFHSLPKMGREANVFDIKSKALSYGSIIEAIKEKSQSTFKKTIEFYPEEGKYHYDGHRNCNFSIDPQKESSQICPVCGKRLVIGVLHRVNDLADRPDGYAPKSAIPYIHLIPLIEVVSYVKGKSTYSKDVTAIRDKLVSAFGTEFNVLMSANQEAISEASDVEIAQAIQNMRDDKVSIMPGYDGTYGKIDLLNREKPSKPKPKQRGISQFM